MLEIAEKEGFSGFSGTLNTVLPTGYLRAGTGTAFDLCGRVKYAIRCSASNADPHPKDKAGDTIPQKISLVKYSCSRLSCPVCCESTAQRDARRVADRLEGLSGEYAASWVSTGKRKHFVFSPIGSQDIEKYKMDGGRALRKDVGKLLKTFMKNFYGGVLVVHFERKRHCDGSDCNQKGCTRKHVWTPGAHVHYVGYGYVQNFTIVDKIWHGWHIPMTIRFHDQGWIYKKIKESYFDGVREKRDVFGTVAYLLTHSALFMGVHTDEYGQEKERLIGQAYHYIGGMANCKGGYRILDKRWVTEKCEICGADIHRYQAHTVLGTGVTRYLGNGTKIVIPAIERTDLQADLGCYRRREIEVEWYLLRRIGWRVYGGKRRPYYSTDSKNGQSTIALGHDESEY